MQWRALVRGRKAAAVGALAVLAAGCSSESANPPPGGGGSGGGTTSDAGPDASGGSGGAATDAASDASDGGVDYEVLFASGFELDTEITSDFRNLTGTDHSTNYSWDQLPDLIDFVDRTRFTYVVSSGVTLTDYQLPELIEDEGPTGQTSRLLQFQNIADDPNNSSTSRTEFSLFFPPNDYQEGHVRYWMKLADNLDQVIPFDQNAGWYMIMEWKEPNSGVTLPDSECADMGCTPAGSNNYRINIGIDKVRDSSELFWVLHGESPQPCRCGDWTVTNDTVPVPLGEWFLVEAYMRRHGSDGRVFFSVNGEVVADLLGRTQHPDNPLPLQFWSFFKLYHGNDWRNLGPTKQWYDDLEILGGEPPVDPEYVDTIP